MTSWVRSAVTQNQWATQWLKIASVPAGETLFRCHFGFTFQGVSSTMQNQTALAEDYIAFGVVCQLSTVGSTPPNPETTPDDVNPPTGRWLWWGIANMRPMTFGGLYSDVTNWATSETFENLSTRGEAFANTTSPNTLDVYLSWSPWTTSAWAARGTVTGSCWSSVLYY